MTRSFEGVSANDVLERLAGLEGRDLGSGDLDLGTGGGVAADALGAGLDLKRAKADELDLLAFLEGCGDGVESGGDDGFGFLLGNAGLFSGAAMSSVLFMVNSLLFVVVLPRTVRGGGYKQKTTRRFSFRGVLGLVPEAGELVERERGHLRAARGAGLLHAAEAGDEFLAGGVQRVLGVDVQKAAGLDGGKEHVAELLGEVRAALDGLAQLAHFLVELVQRAGDVGKFKAGLGGLALELVRAPEGGSERATASIASAVVCWPFSCRLSASQFTRTSSLVSAAAVPKTWGWRKMSFLQM